jgi:hypothetical protein
MKASAKLNLYDFPGMYKTGIVPFYYFNVGYFWRNRGENLKIFSH